MTKTLLMGLAFIALAHASAGDKATEIALDKGAFGRSLDSMKPSDVSRMTAEERAEFRAKLARERDGSPYRNGHGAYKGQVDQWDAHADRAERGERLADADPLAVPMRMRPMALKEVVDMFRVTEAQLMANPEKARQFYTELQATKKSESYKTQRNTKAVADKWIAWLNDNGFGDVSAAAATGSRMDARGGDEAREATMHPMRGRSADRRATDDVAPRARSKSAERRRLEADRRDIEDQVAATKPKR